MDRVRALRARRAQIARIAATAENAECVDEVTRDAKILSRGKGTEEWGDLMPDELESFYEAMGKLVITFANSEALVMMAINSIAQSKDQVIFALVAEISFSKRLDALRTIIRMRIKDAVLLSDTDALINEFSELEEARNRFVHTAWGISGDGIFAMKSTAKRKRGLVHSIVPESPSTLTAIADRILAANDNLGLLLGRIKEAMSKSE